MSSFVGSLRAASHSTVRVGLVSPLLIGAIGKPDVPISQELSPKELKRSIRLAVDISDRAPGPAVGELRKVLDIIIRNAYHRRIRHPRSEPLQNLIGPLAKAGYLPCAL